MSYCDAIIPPMGKKHYFVKTVDYALLSSQPISNDEGLFGSMSGALCDGMSNKMSTDGWERSLLSEVFVNVPSELMGEHHLMIERVVEWLHVPPCLIDKVSGCDMTNMIDIF